MGRENFALTYFMTTPFLFLEEHLTEPVTYETYFENHRPWNEPKKYISSQICSIFRNLLDWEWCKVSLNHGTLWMQGYYFPFCIQHTQTHGYPNTNIQSLVNECLISFLFWPPGLRASSCPGVHLGWVEECGCPVWVREREHCSSQHSRDNGV